MDKRHIKVMKYLDEGCKLVEIEERTGISINVIKNLSRIRNMRQSLRGMNIPQAYIDLFDGMDFKTLELADVIRSKDKDFIIKCIGATYNAKKKDIKTICDNIKNSSVETTPLTLEVDVSKLHNDLELVLRRYYHALKFVTATQISKDKNKFDCIACDYFKNIHIIDVRVNQKDFDNCKKYRKYNDYKKYCNKLFILISNDVSLTDEDIKYFDSEGVGVYSVDLVNKSIETVLEAKQGCLNDIIKDELIHKIKDKIKKESRK